MIVIPGERLTEDSVSQFIKDLVAPMKEISFEDAAHQAEDFGFNFGPCFRLITKWWCGRGINIFFLFFYLQLIIIDIGVMVDHGSFQEKGLSFYP